MAHANARLIPTGRLILCQRIAAGRPVAHVAAEMGISRTCAYRWWGRYRQAGPAGLIDRPSSAHHHPRRTPAQLEAQVLELRQARKLGPARIGPLVGLAPSTVYRVLRRHRLNRLTWMDRPTGQLIRRYVRLYTTNAERTAALDSWLHLYNHHRAHTALGGHPPISRVNNPPDSYS